MKGGFSSGVMEFFDGFRSKMREGAVPSCSVRNDMTLDAREWYLSLWELRSKSSC